MSLRRLRLLCLLPFSPQLRGLHGGTRAIAAFIAAMAPRHDIAALYLRGRDEPPIDPELAERCALVEEVPRDATPRLVSRAAHRARVLRAVLGGMPRWPAYWAGSNFGRVAARLAREWRPDVVHAEFHVMGQFLPSLRASGALRVLTPHEPGAAAAAERVEETSGAARIGARMEARRWRRFERRVMQYADVVVGFTPRDRETLRRESGSTPVVDIPFGIVPPQHPFGANGVVPPEVLFVGNFMHPPNADAALALVREVAPALWRRAPQAKIVIVGPAPPPSLRAAAAQAGGTVEITGEVESVDPYLARAAVIAAPIRRGGGMRVKILEALAAGKAVVASSLALEGMAVRDGEQVMIADDPGTFAGAIGLLLERPEQRHAMAYRARAWAAAEMSHDAWADRWDALYEEFGAGRDR